MATPPLTPALLACCLGIASSPALGEFSPGQIASLPCRGCHGAQGISKNPAYPHLAGQAEDYLIKSLREFRNGQRQDPAMNRVAAALSDTDIEQLAHYYAGLPR